ncbi:MLO-like protein 6 [Nymphaea thermarum]|nr:MLO-like protein 6 [Nymphaea thermarum]
MAGAGGGRSLQETPTWAVAVVCFVLVLISLFIEHFIHLLGKWLTKKNKRALYEALEKIKSELMLMGFISLLVTVLQDPISQICIPERFGKIMLPCRREVNQSSYGTKDESETNQSSDDSAEAFHSRKLLLTGPSGADLRRILAGGGGGDKCGSKARYQYIASLMIAKIPLVSSTAITQLHIFIFVLAVFHVLYCITTMALGRAKMRRWKAWEQECKTTEYRFTHGNEIEISREVQVCKRNVLWKKALAVLEQNTSLIVCFFRQFLGSVQKVDYLTLRHGFVMAHLSPHSTTNFDFQKYIRRSLDEDFKVVVGISPVIWLCAIILMVGTKLQVVITKMGLQIQERGDVVKGVPVVQPTDHLFWFNRPRLILCLIHFVLFQNAFQLAFFVWAWCTFGLRSCFHRRVSDISIRISMGILIQFLCSYVTLPLYALVTQMGTNMKPTIFEGNVAGALRRWHNGARKNLKEGRKPGYMTPTPGSSRPRTPRSSNPGTPIHDSSPVHLLHRYRSEMDPSVMSPAFYNDGQDAGGSASPSHHTVGEGSSSHHHRHGNPEPHGLEM